MGPRWNTLPLHMFWPYCGIWKIHNKNNNQYSVWTSILPSPTLGCSLLRMSASQMTIMILPLVLTAAVFLYSPCSPCTCLGSLQNFSVSGDTKRWEIIDITLSFALCWPLMSAVKCKFNQLVGAHFMLWRTSCWETYAKQDPASLYNKYHKALWQVREVKESFRIQYVEMTFTHHICGHYVMPSSLCQRNSKQYASNKARFLFSLCVFSSAYDVVSRQKVAVKKLSRPFQSLIHSRRSYRELRLLKHMKHENVSAPL